MRPGIHTPLGSSWCDIYSAAFIGSGAVRNWEIFFGPGPWIPSNNLLPSTDTKSRSPSNGSTQINQILGLRIF